jgi:trehalose 6-phosphate synthase
MTGLFKVLGICAASYVVSRIGTAASYRAAAVARFARRSSRARTPMLGHGSWAGRSRIDDVDRAAVPSQSLLADITASREVIVVSNREPCIHDATPAGEIVCRRSAGGLVTALEPIVQACRGIWVAQGSGSGDRVVTDPAGHVVVGQQDSSYLLRRVWVSAEEQRSYYDGFANEGLWPLCHAAFSAPIFRRSDWIGYERINRRFADAVAEEIRGDQAIVLVQDYHLALVPRMLRERRPDAIVVAFWHVPWPAAEQFSLCPYGREIVEGLLGSNILGFQTSTHVANFMRCVDDSAAQTVDRRLGIVRDGDRTVSVRAYPISIEWPSRWMSAMPDIEECRRTVRAELRLDQRCSLVVSVDRLDYTKGFEERLAAIERLLEIRAVDRQRLAFLQLAAPTRVTIPRYQELAARVRSHIARINQRLGDDQFQPVIYLEQFTEPAEVFRYYRAADVCYVGSLDDGMNLVAKEFVSARDDEQGTLVLSRFTGAARELAGAVIVNPFDVDGVAEALASALTTSREAQRTRMHAMRRWIAEHNVYGWASEMLADAAELQRVSLGPQPQAVFANPAVAAGFV